MLIKIILNKCRKFKSFVYRNIRFAEHDGKQVIEVEVKPRKNSKGAPCSRFSNRPTYVLNLVVDLSSNDRSLSDE